MQLGAAWGLTEKGKDLWNVLNLSVINSSKLYTEKTIHIHKIMDIAQRFEGNLLSFICEKFAIWDLRRNHQIYGTQSSRKLNQSIN